MIDKEPWKLIRSQESMRGRGVQKESILKRFHGLHGLLLCCKFFWCFENNEYVEIAQTYTHIMYNVYKQTELQIHIAHKVKVLSPSSAQVSWTSGVWSADGLQVDFLQIPFYEKMCSQ